jgi:hypothetical protein
VRDDGEVARVLLIGHAGLCGLRVAIGCGAGFGEAIRRAGARLGPLANAPHSGRRWVRAARATIGAAPGPRNSPHGAQERGPC